MAGSFRQGFPPDFDGQQLPPHLGAVLRWGVVAFAIILLFVFLSFVRSIYTDWLWFDSLGLRSVFVKVLAARIVLFFLGAGVFGLLLSASIYVAHRLSLGPETIPIPLEVMAFLRRLVFWGTVAGVVILSIIMGTVTAAQWEAVLKYLNAVPFGELDPIYNRDVSFYVFRLPVYNFLQGWLLGAAVLVLLGTLATYFVNFSLRGIGFSVNSGLKVHVSIIGAAIMFILAWGHWLGRWELLLSQHGVIFGASYADLHARRPALFILFIVAIASGILILLNGYMRGLRLLVGAFVLWVAMSIVVGSIWPALMQRFTVNPQEFVREQPYISHNIESTRKGFALDRIEETFYPAEASFGPEMVRDNLLTINNIRLWDYRPLRDVYRQVQLIRPYYDFKDIDVDRYTIGGQYRQVMLSVREVAPEKLESRAQTWVNRRLIYTHGFGIAMSPVTEFTPEGRPLFFAKDIPSDGAIPVKPTAPDAAPEMVIANPRIYYGENTAGYVIVNTRTAELDYQPETGDPVRNHYSGSGGVRLSSMFRRLAYAWQFGDINILISGEITEDSLIQYRRNIQERIATVAPFLLLDRDPYIVVADGQLYWVQDAYTTTDHYPYSDPLNGSFNYIRNSVKVTVDAFTGDLRFYLADPADPVIQTYARVFPDLFLPPDRMPDSLKAHIRYPLDLFAFQAQKYARYHMRNPQIFYNNEDLWTIPQEKFGQGQALQPVEPYYVIMKLPGEEREEFVLLLPYVPSQRKNLIGWLAARSDGEHYGKLRAFVFPKDRQLDGPEQVEARIDNDPFISEWFTLRCQEGSVCIRGNLLVIPIGSSLLYAEPVYLQAEGVEFPELKQVILVSGERVTMRGSVAEAVAAITGVTPPSGTVTGGPPDTPPSTAPPTEAFRAEMEKLEEAIQQLKDDLARLEEALRRLRELSGGQ